MDNQTKVRTPLFPTYSGVRRMLEIWNGISKSAVYSMIKAILNQTGTPQNPVDWSEPDLWINARLKGKDAELATLIWKESDGNINPRHVHGYYLFINRYHLLLANQEGVYQLSERGQAFLSKGSKVVREIDDAEGLPHLLGILSTKAHAKRADLLPEWGEFLKQYSNYGTPSTIKDTLRRRLVNLVERGFVTREGNAYVITETGINYATPFDKPQADPRRKVLQAINKYNKIKEEQLLQRLGEIHPYQFEHLVRDLLEAMGYDDVEVTKESGDKGVDVVATVQFGITTIKEVVQVKRHRGSIGRPVLDQLRGSLPYHKALRGTIISTGKFTKGCQEAALFPGAAPIGLIDGKKLLSLLIENEIGIINRAVDLYEIDETFFSQPSDAEENEILEN